MFDPVTTALIRAAPPLEGLDLEGLPKRLTEAFANIVSARIRLRSATGGGDDALASTLGELRRLAAAHEAYAALLQGRENRASAAFVAASAHQAVSLGLRRETDTSRVSAAAVSSEICATLLFLIAEAHADAAEAAKRIVPDPDGSAVERALVLAIRNLAQGRLSEIVDADLPEIRVEADEFAVRALEALRLMLLRGVVNLARQLRLRVDLAPEAGGIEPAAAVFARVRMLCVEPIEDIGSTEGPIFSLYPGPLHLANLLLGLERNLLRSALTRIPTPNGAEETGWWHILRRMARQRPYLWRNHSQAIENGYLERGVSSAISFPTGGGKSTLAELKIATVLLRGERVVFLAPTHALVGQTQRSLSRTFEDYKILADVDDDISIDSIVFLGEVTVMTPERCLMLLSVQPEAFVDLGLIVFDECHLLHPRDEDRSRRGLDSMLALLNLSQVAPQADLLLLSAMMKNTGEIAGWITQLTTRPCLPLDLSWKPTRQVRGCVVYPAEQISMLNARLDQARIDFPDQAQTPQSVKRELLAQPYGLFGLLQTWSTTDRQDYALLQLLTNAQPLSTGKRRRGGWYLTPNGNQTSGAIAAAAVTAGMKTLVFVQTTVFCEACAKAFPERIPPSAVKLTDEERKWRDLAVEEMGGSEYCYLKLDDEGVLRTGAVTHHALLLREERELHESLFRRPDGVRALFATSTLAQGMNLPGEVVVISGDSRFDPDADKMKKLEAHELLNAAGRAGRAGEGAQGFVLLVPSKVIDFDDEKSKINGHWMELQAIFEQADQCLIIDDPLEAVLDRIHEGVTTSGAAGYLLSKLPLTVAGGSDDPVKVLLKRSLAAYRAVQAGNTGWIESRIASAVAARVPSQLADQNKWIEQVASSSGLSVQVLQQILEQLDKGAFSGGAPEIIDALLTWLESDPIRLMDLIRPESLEELFGEQYKKLSNDKARATQALSALRLLWPLWMSGAPLSRLEAEFLGKKTGLGYCKSARHFVSRIVPELAFLSALPGRMMAARLRALGSDAPIPTALATLGSIIREGCDSPETLATRLHCGRSISRVAARAYFEKIRAHVPPGSVNESFEDTRERIRHADAVSAFSG